MSDNQNTETISENLSDVENQTIQDTEPENQTIQDTEPKTTQDESNSETSENDTNNQNIETIEQKITRLEKIVKDNQAAFTKVSQEKAEILRNQEVNQYKSDIDLVNYEITQSKAILNQNIDKLRLDKRQLLTELINQYKNDEISQVVYDYQVQQVESGFDSLSKQEFDKFNVISNNIKQKQVDLAKKTISNFKNQNPDFVTKSYYNNMLSKCEEFGFDSNSMEKVKILAKTLIDDYDSHIKNGVSAKNEKDKSRLNSTAINGLSSSMDSSQKIFTRRDIQNMSLKEFGKNEHIIMEQMKKGLIE